MHDKASQRLIQVYSEPFVTLTYSQFCHILSTAIFTTGGTFKTLLKFCQAYSQPCHSQDSLLKYYSAIFTHIQDLV